jgi:hypothetical protein
MGKSKKASASTGKIEYVSLSPAEIIKLCKDLNYDNLRLPPDDEGINEQESVTYIKMAFLKKKGERSEEEVEEFKVEKPEKPAKDTPAGIREHSYLPENKEVVVMDGDEAIYLSMCFKRSVAFSALKFPKKATDKKSADDSAEPEKKNKDAALSFVALTREQIAGGDYVANYTEGMSEDAKAMEDDRCRAIIDSYQSATSEVVDALIAFHRCWHIFCNKLKEAGMVGCNDKTPVFDVAQFSYTTKKKGGKKDIVTELAQPIVRIKFPIHHYNRQKHGPIGRKFNKRVGRYFNTKNGEKFNPVLFDGKKAQNGEDPPELMYRYEDPETKEKKKVWVTYENMSKVVTPKSLIGGTCSLFDANKSTFGLAPKVGATAIYVRRHKTQAKFANLDPTLAEGMGEFDYGGADSDDEYEAPQKKGSDSDDEPKKAKSKSKSKAKSKKEEDDDDSDDAPPKKGKSKKKVEVEDDSDDDAPPKKGKSKKEDSDDDAPPKKTPSKSKKEESGSDSDAPPKKTQPKKKMEVEADDDSDDESSKKVQPKKMENKKKVEDEDSDDESSKKAKPKKTEEDSDDESSKKAKPKKADEDSDDESSKKAKPKKEDKKKAETEEGAVPMDIDKPAKVEEPAEEKPKEKKKSEKSKKSKKKNDSDDD